MVLVDGSVSGAGSAPFWMNSLSHRAALLVQRAHLPCSCAICCFSQAFSILRRAEEDVGVCTAPECLQPSDALATIAACMQKMPFGFVCSFQESVVLDVSHKKPLALNVTGVLLHPWSAAQGSVLWSNMCFVQRAPCGAQGASPSSGREGAFMSTSRGL